MRAKPWEVPNGLWERIEPLPPPRQRRFRYPGRRPFLISSKETRVSGPLGDSPV
jgi:hypothetical protein